MGAVGVFHTWFLVHAVTYHELINGLLVFHLDHANIVLIHVLLVHLVNKSRSLETTQCGVHMSVEKRQSIFEPRSLHDLVQSLLVVHF